MANANENQGNLFADYIPKSLTNFTINTTAEECRKVYAGWTTYDQVTALINNI